LVFGVVLLSFLPRGPCCSLSFFFMALSSSRFEVHNECFSRFPPRFLGSLPTVVAPPHNSLRSFGYPGVVRSSVSAVVGNWSPPALVTDRVPRTSRFSPPTAFFHSLEGTPVVSIPSAAWAQHLGCVPSLFFFFFPSFSSVPRATVWFCDQGFLHSHRIHRLLVGFLFFFPFFFFFSSPLVETYLWFFFSSHVPSSVFSVSTHSPLGFPFFRDFYFHNFPPPVEPFGLRCVLFLLDFLEVLPLSIYLHRSSPADPPPSPSFFIFYLIILVWNFLFLPKYLGWGPRGRCPLLVI